MQTKNFITLLLLLICKIGFSQSYQTDFDISKNYGFAHFTGTYGNEIAHLEIIYQKSSAIVYSTLMDISNRKDSPRESTLCNVIRGAYLFSTISPQPLGLAIGSLVGKKYDSISYSTAFYKYPVRDSIDGEFDLNRNSWLPDTGKCCDYNDNAFIGSFLNNYTKFVGRREFDSLNLKPIILMRDTANEEKYMNELNEVNKLMHQKYEGEKLKLLSISYLDDSLICGVFNLGNTTREDVEGSFDGPTKLKAFTFLRKQHTLINTANIFSDTFNNKWVGIFSVPTERQLGGLDERGRIGILYKYPPDANLNNFYLTDKGVVFVWVMKDGRGRNPGYSYFEIQYVIPYEWLEKSAYYKIMKLLQ